MLKISKIAWKEIKLIKAQRRSLILILLYPLVVIFALAVAFSGTSFFGNMFGEAGLEKVDVMIYLPTQSTYFDSYDFLEKLGKYEKVKLHKANSPEKVMQGIELRVARVGLVINEPTAENQTIEVELFYDNSSLLAAKTISTYARFAINNYAYKKSTEVLSSIWNDLAKIKSNLTDEARKGAEFRGKLQGARQNLVNLQQRVNQIDLISIKSGLNSFSDYYAEAKNEINYARQEGTSTKNSLDSYQAKLVSTRQELVSYRTRIQLVRDQVSNLRKQLIAPLDAQALQAENELNDVLNKLNSTISEIDQAVNDIDDARGKLDQVDAKLVNTDRKLDQANSQINSFKSTINSIEQTINEVKILVEDSLVMQAKTAEDLEATLALLDSLIARLTEFQSYSPSYLVNPVRINEKKMYPVDELAVITPIGIAIVLLLTCMLLTSVSVLLEKEEGVRFRSRLTPTGKFSLFFGKILGQMLFALVEAMIILIIAVVLFKVPIVGSLLSLFIVLALISFSFICLGLFLTNFTQTQSTAVLSSLLIVVPMIFLSGIVFPTEFMPALISILSELLPLTIAINLLEAVIIKGTSLWLILASILWLVIPACILFAISLLNKNL